MAMMEARRSRVIVAGECVRPADRRIRTSGTRRAVEPARLTTYDPDADTRLVIADIEQLNSLTTDQLQPGEMQWVPRG